MSNPQPPREQPYGAYPWPQQPYGMQQMAAPEPPVPKKTKPRVLVWVLLGVFTLVGFAWGLAFGLGILAPKGNGEPVSTPTSVAPTTEGELPSFDPAMPTINPETRPLMSFGDNPPRNYGDHEFFDKLADKCNSGHMTSCDFLYELSPAGSEYEEIGNSCGGTHPGGYDLYCDEDFSPEYQMN